MRLRIASAASSSLSVSRSMAMPPSGVMGFGQKVQHVAPFRKGLFELLPRPPASMKRSARQGCRTYGPAMPASSWCHARPVALGSKCCVIGTPAPDHEGRRSRRAILQSACPLAALPPRPPRAPARPGYTPPSAGRPRAGCQNPPPRRRSTRASRSRGRFAAASSIWR